MKQNGYLDTKSGYPFCFMFNASCQALIHRFFVLNIFKSILSPQNIFITLISRG